MTNQGIAVTEQDSRRTLLDHIGSQLRFWGTSLVALAVGIFGAIQVKDNLNPVFFELTISVIVAQGMYAFLRVVFLGRLAEALTLEKNLGGVSLLTDVHNAAILALKAKGFSMRFLYRVSDLKGWLGFSIPLTIALWLAWSALRHLPFLVMDFVSWVLSFFPMWALVLVLAVLALGLPTLLGKSWPDSIKESGS